MSDDNLAALISQLQTRATQLSSRNAVLEQLIKRLQSQGIALTFCFAIVLFLAGFLLIQIDELGGNLTSSRLAMFLYATGAILVIGGLLGAALEVWTRFSFAGAADRIDAQLQQVATELAALNKSLEESTAPGAPPESASEAVSSTTAASVPAIPVITAGIEAFLGLLTKVSDLFKAVPTWVFSIVVGIIIFIIGSLFDGYDGFGVDVSTPHEQQAQRERMHGTAEAELATSQTAEAREVLGAHETAEAQVIASATIDQRQHERVLELIRVGALPDTYTAITPMAASPSAEAEADATSES